MSFLTPTVLLESLCTNLEAFLVSKILVLRTWNKSWFPDQYANLVNGLFFFLFLCT